MEAAVRNEYARRQAETGMRVAWSGVLAMGMAGGHGWSVNRGTGREVGIKINKSKLKFDCFVIQSKMVLNKRLQGHGAGVRRGRWRWYLAGA